MGTASEETPPHQARRPTEGGALHTLRAPPSSNSPLHKVGVPPHDFLYGEDQVEELEAVVLCRRAWFTAVRFTSCQREANLWSTQNL